MKVAFDPLWLAALPGLVAVGLWALTDLQRFVSFALTAAMILPMPLAQPGGTQVALADVLLLFGLGAWLVAGSIRKAAQPWLAGNPFLMPALVFTGVNGMSLIWSDSPRSTLIFTIQLLEIVVVFPIVFASIPRNMASVRQGFVVFILCTCVLAVFTVKSYGLKGGSGSLTGTAGGTGLNTLNKNVIGSFVAAGLVMSFTLCIAEARTWPRRAFGLATLIEVAGVVASSSRGSLIGTLVAILTAGFLLRRGRLIAVGGAAVLAIGYLTVFGVSQNVDRTTSGSYDSSQVRVYSFRDARRKIAEDPFLGVGGGAYTDYVSEVGILLPDPNNMFLLTWAEVGIPGMLALLFMLGQYIRILLSVRRLPSEYATPAVTAGCVSLSLFIHFQFDVTWTRGTSTLAFAMIGVMLAALRLARDRTRPVDAPVWRPPQPIDVRPSTPRVAA